MSGKIVTTIDQMPAPLAPSLSGTARAYASEAAASNTKRAYRIAWADFIGWCEAEGHVPLPAAPEVVGSFLAARAGTLRPRA